MATSYSYDVTAKDFAQLVIEKSKKTPVLVDFWAEWCAPCRHLSPILEKLAEKYAGELILAKVNVDHEQALAVQFGISGIPAVKIFKDGAVVDEFVGLLQPAEIEAIIKPFISKAKPEDKRAVELLKSGKYPEAEKVIREKIQKEPDNAELRENLIRALLLQFKIDEAKKETAGIEIPSRGVELLMEGLDFWRGVAEVKPDWKPAQGASKLEALLKAAEYHAKERRYSDAMEQLLEIVKQDKDYMDGIGKRALVFLFVLIGSDDPAVREYQTILPRYLY